MTTAAQEHIPRVHQFEVGAHGLPAHNPTTVYSLDTEDIVVLKRVSQLGAPLSGLIENLGDVAFVFSLEDSDDNDEDGAGDAYAGVNIRVDSAPVANVTVVPGGKVAFTVEGATKAYLLFKADDQSLSFGRLTLAHWFGELQRRQRKGIADNE